MAYPVKFFHSGMAGAPVVSNNWGDLIGLLDGCLVNGFNLKSIDSITSTAGVATASINSGHAYVKDQIVLITGCEQSEYNGEQRVTDITANTFTFDVAGSPASPATTSSSISCKVAPLGFEIAFTGTNKRVYRSTNPQSKRPFLRVDNSLDPVWTTTYAKYAKVTMAENMTGIDTFVGARAPYDPALPTVNEVGTGSGSAAVNGWMRWYQARNIGSSSDASDGGAGARAWVVVGDDRGFYLHLSHGVGLTAGMAGYAFNDFASFKSGDPFNTILCASEVKAAQAASGNPPHPDSNNYFAYTGEYTGKYLMRDWSGLGNPIRCSFLSLNYGNNQQVSGYTGNVPFPNGPDYSLILHPVYIREESRGDLRGIMPGYFHTPQMLPYSHLSIVENVIGYPGRKFLMVEGAYGSSLRSRYFYDITGPWR